MQFQHIQSEIGALEAEEVGVEHLLRDIKDTSVSTLSQSVTEKLSSLKMLVVHLQDMHTYLENVCDGKLPINHEIMNIVQDIFNLLPNLKRDTLVSAFNIKTNDMFVVMYVASLIRSVIALHMLINNKLANNTAEAKKDEEAEKKDADKKKSEEKETEKKKSEEKEAEKKK
mgnify:CR=1 FL=1